MKKLLFLTSYAVLSLATRVFGSGGDFIFGAPAGTVWDTFGTPIRAPGNMNVSFLWGTGTPLIDSIALFSPTNAYTPGSPFTAWNDILNDPNFQIARNDDTGQLVVGSTTATGLILYNNLNPFHVTGTSTSGGIVTVYMIAWQNSAPTPALAASAGYIVGWSAPFAYNYANNVSVPFTLGSAAIVAGVDAHFGVGVPGPEPSAFALFGLGATALVSLRRRRKL